MYVRGSILILVVKCCLLAHHWCFTIVVIGCVASISAAVTITTTSGSSATYQCSDGSSGVYTTQCTSDGVWEPDPNTLECGEPGITFLYLYVIIL